MAARLAIFSLLAWALACALPAAGQSGQFYGVWETAFNHDISPGTFPISGHAQHWPLSTPPEVWYFNAAHMALIPAGPHKGKVVAWDFTGRRPSTSSAAHAHYIQRWAIIDPEASGSARFLNFSLQLPYSGLTTLASLKFADLSCSGFAWTSDGRLLVAGGTGYVDSVASGLPETGLKLVYTYDPDAGSQFPYGRWTKHRDMKYERWYATVVIVGDDRTHPSEHRMLVLGGTLYVDPEPVSASPSRNSYQSFLPDPGSEQWETIAGVQVWFGPGDLLWYARSFHLSELAYNGAYALGRTVVVPFFPPAASVDHTSAPGSWLGPHTRAVGPYTDYSSAVLLPGQDLTDVIMHIWGHGSLTTVEVIDMKAANPLWSAGPPLNQGRSRGNTVILPDASVLMIRGDSAAPGQAEIPNLTSELYKNGVWHLLADAPAPVSPRAYHSAAVLLPSGKVLVGGGNTRTKDYEVYRPWYLDGYPRPVIGANFPQTIRYGQTTDAFSFTFDQPAPGLEVEKAVLIAPGATTHHSDMHQRYVPLEVVSVTQPSGDGGPGSITVKGPKNATYAPTGYYMLFLVTSGGIPSKAEFVKLEW